MSILFIGIIAFIFAIFVVVGFFIYMIMMRFDFYADVSVEKSNGAEVIVLNNAKIKVSKKKGQVEKWTIKGLNMEAFEPLDRTDILTVEGSKKGKIYILIDSLGQVHAKMSKFDEAERRMVLTPRFRNSLDWIVYESEEREKLKEKQGLLLQNLPLITIIIFMMIFVIAIVFIPKWISSEMDKGYNAYLLRMESLEQRINDNVYLAGLVKQDNINQKSQNWTTTTIGGNG